MNKKNRVSNHFLVEKDSLQEIDDYCKLVQAKTGVIKRRIITSLLLEAIHQDIAHVNEIAPSLSLTPPAPSLDPNFDWHPLPEMPGCVKTREMWEAWVDGYRGLNRTNEKSGDPARWIIPDEPPKGLK